MTLRFFTERRKQLTGEVCAGDAQLPRPPLHLHVVCARLRPVARGSPVSTIALGYRTSPTKHLDYGRYTQYPHALKRGVSQTEGTCLIARTTGWTRSSRKLLCFHRVRAPAFEPRQLTRHYPPQAAFDIGIAHLGKICIQILLRRFITDD
jgi:hypothetical protein